MAVQTGVPVATAYMTGVANTTTNGVSVKPASGVLFTLSATTAVTGLTIYDSLVSGALGSTVLSNPNNIIFNGALTVGQVILFNTPFSVGLVITATAAATFAISYN